MGVLRSGSMWTTSLLRRFLPELTTEASINIMLSRRWKGDALASPSIGDSDEKVVSDIVNLGDAGELLVATSSVHICPGVC